jgi:hypothetical protein
MQTQVHFILILTKGTTKHIPFFLASFFVLLFSLFLLSCTVHLVFFTDQNKKIWQVEVTTKTRTRRIGLSTLSVRPSVGQSETRETYLFFFFFESPTWFWCYFSRCCRHSLAKSDDHDNCQTWVRVRQGTVGGRGNLIQSTVSQSVGDLCSSIWYICLLDPLQCHLLSCAFPPKASKSKVVTRGPYFR